MRRSVREHVLPFHRRAIGKALALWVLGTASALVIPAQGAQVWVASSAQKVRPLTPPPADAQGSAQIFAAKNEFEAFQVVVTGAASAVTMSLRQLSDGRGNVISGRDLVLYREALLEVTTPTGGDGAVGKWPDALVPDIDPIAGEKRDAFPFDVPAGESRVVYVDVHVPAGAPAGVYSGTLDVTGGITAQVPVRLTVWNFSIPSTATLRTAFGLNWAGPCRGHGDRNCSNLAVELPLRARYVQAALDNRISLHMPYYTSPVGPGGSGSFSEFDRWAGPFLDGTAPTRLAGAKLTAVSLARNVASADSGMVAAWSQHFRSKGWFPALFNYVCDEPPMTCSWSDIPLRNAESIAGDPDVPRLVTTTTAEAAAKNATGISLFTPVVNFMEGRPGTSFAGNQRSRYPGTIWWYQSCMSFGCSGVGPGFDSAAHSGWPSYAVDTDATRNRAMEWLSFSYDIAGELYYETTMAFSTGDPWVNQYNFGGTGDGNLFYPGTPARIGGQTEIPVESLRMKGIRDGMEDYELLNLAAQLGYRDTALAIARSVYPSTYQATTTPAQLDGARAQLAALIVNALTPAPGPDGGTGASDGGGAPAPDGGVGRGPPGGALDGGIPEATAGFIPRSASGTGFPMNGCAGAGADLAWVGLPLLVLFGLRRRRGGRRS